MQESNNTFNLSAEELALLRKFGKVSFRPLGKGIFRCDQIPRLNSLTQNQCGELRQLVKSEKSVLKKALVGRDTSFVKCPHCSQINRGKQFGPGDETCIHCRKPFYIVIDAQAKSKWVAKYFGSTSGTITCPYYGTENFSREGQHSHYCRVCTQQFIAEGTTPPASAPMPATHRPRTMSGTGMGK